MRKLWVVLFGLITILGSTVILSSPANAAQEHTFVGSVTDAPDNHCPAWARDTFERVTTLTETDVDGVWNIRQDISGTWVSTSDAEIKGTIEGFVEYTITGSLRDDASSVDDDVNLGSLACKSDAVSNSPNRTVNWAVRYFQDGAVIGPLTAWEYVYDTSCDEPFVENDSSDAMGPDVFTEVCVAPTPSPSESPQPTPSAAPSPSDPAGSPTPTQPSAGKPGLPVTGTPVGIVAGAGVGLAGLGTLLYFLGRKRRNPTTS